jgi:hypothetical protein
MKTELNSYAYWNIHISLLFAMNPAAPDERPRGGSGSASIVANTALPAVPRRGPDAGEPL